MSRDERIVPLVVDDAAVLSQVRHWVDYESTTRATELTIAAGVRPPDDDPDWLVTLTHDADGEPPEGALAWHLPPIEEIEEQ